MAAHVLVVYYSATGSVHQLAKAVAEGAESAGAEVRLRRVAELAPAEAIASNPDWARHRQETESTVEVAELDDLEWADGYAFGTPTRYGAPAAQLKQFIDSAGGLWQAGKLADKPVTTFVSSAEQHGGQESTILSLNNVFYHWGALIVPSATPTTSSTPPVETPTGHPGPPDTPRRPRTRSPWTAPASRGPGWPGSRRCSRRSGRGSPRHGAEGQSHRVP